MNKKIFMTAFFAGWISMMYAQTDTTKTKLFSHTVGVQVNQLIKQIINLNSVSTPINDPYLLTYSINLVNSGWGINAGIGYNYQSIVDKDMPGNRETKINDLFYRIGVGRKCMIGKKLEAGFGLDFAGDSQLDKTFSVVSEDFGSFTDSSVTNVTSKTTSKGGGLQLTFAFHITPRFIVSTEVTYYYLKSKQKQNVIVTETIHDLTSDETTVTTSNTNLETDISKFSFTVPVALFLAIKF
jgi:hypothetical protein